MRKIANILTKNVVSGETVYNIVSDGDNLISGIPTLVVGNSLVKDIYPDYNIIDWQIKDDVFWTFGPRERRERFEKDLPKFKKMSAEKICKKIQYHYYNLFLKDKTEINKFLKDIVSEDTIIYIYNNMCYVYESGTSIVEGISLTDAEYLDCDTKKLLSYFYKHKAKVLTSKDIPVDIKIMFQNNAYIIPYICS